MSALFYVVNIMEFNFTQRRWRRWWTSYRWGCKYCTYSYRCPRSSIVGDLLACSRKCVCISIGTSSIEWWFTAWDQMDAGTVLYYTTLYCTVLCCLVLYLVLRSAVQCSAVQCSAVMWCDVMWCTILWFIVLSFSTTLILAL